MFITGRFIDNLLAIIFAPRSSTLVCSFRKLLIFVFLMVDENQDHRDDFNDTLSTLSVDTSESDRESSGDDTLCSSQLSKDVSPGPRLPALCTYNLKACQVIFKAVFGKVQVEREDVVKVLKKKFSVKQDRLKALTMTQLMEVLVKKLVNQRYCSIKDGPETNITNLKMEDITVHKEIAL